MPDKPKPPPADMTAKLAAHVREENKKGLRDPDPEETRRIASKPPKKA